MITDAAAAFMGQNEAAYLLVWVSSRCPRVSNIEKAAGYRAAEGDGDCTRTGPVASASRYFRSGTCA